MNALFNAEIDTKRIANAVTGVSDHYHHARHRQSEDPVMAIKESESTKRAAKVEFV